MLKKKISWVLAMTMAATMLGGCLTTSAEESSYDGTIRWLNYKPEVADAMQEIAAAYTEETGIDVQIETAASGQYEATLTARMDSSDAPTIFVIDSINMLNTWKDYISDLSDTELYSMVTDDSYTMNDGNGTIYGISYALEAWGIIVNKGITDAYFASPNKSTEYTSLDDLYTFDALKAVVEDMTAMKDELGIQGVFGSTSLKAGDDWRYQTHLMNQPLYWEWGGNENIDLNGAVPEFTFEYSENYKNILDLYLNNSVTEPNLVGTKTVDDSMAEFALGQCAMIQNGDWAWNTIANTDGRVVEDENVVFIPISCGVEGEENMGLNVTGSQYMCINSQASEEDQAAAEEFLVWLFSSDTGKQLVAEKLQFMTPFSTMSDATYTNPLYASEAAITEAGKTAYCAAANLIPDQTWKDNMGANLLMYAQGQMEWDDVVSNAVETWAVERDITNTANGN
ncbi:MAG TPA: carbohydrate ABC transporter substrate-binding protein [Candidatus Choladousia intestinavium]|uniref:Carbohydrate ABC transporter substrate-binding protein n=1 Tax=Candidatus Choladousia intestinavium TaxID=2840727 RepID=A0A9D1DA40_9FIRM|nr:carbohydrate ABC transporter substrate-binding protein [Candidatus Choladousia intestinavium]